MSSSYVLVDTDVVSFIFRGDPRRSAYEQILTGSTLALSFMTVAELYQWGHNNNWGERRFAQISAEIERYLVVMPPVAACRLWDQVRAQCRHKGRPISAQDAWNATLALHFGIPLVTGNAKDYEMIDRLEVWTAAE